MRGDEGEGRKKEREERGDNRGEGRGRVPHEGVVRLASVEHGEGDDLVPALLLEVRELS